ncbi:MAG TPA: endonuclease V [Chloroflexi bacterium]|nr:endonuclease V [Chloroflexota bacterium]
MILAVDVRYRGDRAVAAGVLFEAWEDCEPFRILFAQLTGVAAYEPGQFYKRELPCILALVEQLERRPEHILVDGYVCLGRERRPGLGQHVYDALAGQSAVIGVAKSRYRGTPDEARLFRGGSRRPLYVTAVGVGQTEAKEFVMRMCGVHRTPALLKRVDRLSKQPLDDAASRLEGIVEPI